MAEEDPAAPERAHVLACLQQIKPEPSLDNGQRNRLQEECFLERTGREAFWTIKEHSCLLRDAPSSRRLQVRVASESEVITCEA